MTGTKAASFSKMAEYLRHTMPAQLPFRKIICNIYLQARPIETQYTYFNTKLSFV